MNDATITDTFNTRSTGKAEKKKHPPPFSIRLTEKERAILRREAGEQPWSDYIRERVFRSDFSATQRGRRDTASEQALARVLSKLGQSRLASNMNQLAKAANSGTLPVTDDLSDELSSACQDIALMREALIGALGLKVEW